MSNTSRAPRTSSAKPKALFDLDSQVREGERPVPFTVKVGDRVITFKDSQELDWQQQVTIANRQSPHLFFAAVLEEDDYEYWVAQPKIEAWRVGLLIDNYREHYGLTPDFAGN